MRTACAAITFALILSCQPAPREGTASSGSAGPALEASVFSADGVAIHYRVRGAGDPALVFIHGWSCDASYWDGQMETFAPRHRVVAIDLAGHGASGLDRREWSIEAFARDVQAVVEALDLPRVILIGHSMGGYVVLEAARLMPERVIGLVPVDTLHDAEKERDPEEVRAFLSEMESDFRGRAQAFVREMFPPGADRALVDRVAGDMASAPPEVALGALRGIFAHDPKPALAAAKVPIHALMSARYPFDLAVNRRYAPQFEAVAVPGTGHFPMLEDPTAFNRLLEEAVRKIGGGPGEPPSGAGATAEP